MTMVRIVMKSRAFLLFLTTVLGGAVGYCQSFQVWSEVDMSLTFKRTNLLIPSLVRVDTKLPNPQFVATGAIGTFGINQYVSVSAGYLFADVPEQNQIAHVPLVALASSLKSRRWTLSDINRFERLLDYSNQPYRYRNRATVDRAIGQHHSLHLYASNESFENLSSRSWNQNRAQLGIGIPVNRSARLDAYFLQRSAPGRKETSVFGTVVTFKLNKEPSN